MWFLGMIYGLYLITPFLRRIAEDEKLTDYFLLLFTVLVFTSGVLSLTPQSEVRDWLRMFVDCLEVKFVVGFSGYFVWGYRLASLRLSPAARKWIYLSGIAGAVVSAAGNGVLAYTMDQIGTWVYDSMMPNVFLTSTAVFVFCRYNLTGERLSARGRNLVGTVGKWSFGIYLSHVFFLEHLSRVGLPNFFCHPALSVPITSLAVFFCSLALVFLLSKIPGLNKYVI